MQRPYPMEVNGGYPNNHCKVILQNEALWRQFHNLDTEMIVTKSGRRMFPPIHIKAYDLDPNAIYHVYLDFELHSSCRYKYSSSSGWSPAGNEEHQSNLCRYVHPDSPARGQHWMSQTISFGRVKLTNSTSSQSSHVVLSSMHKYQPKIIIIEASHPWTPNVIKFPETQFIAVTAYQNDKITQLKIDHNPFAKGFRESGKSTSKRKSTEVEDKCSESSRTLSPASPKQQLEITSSVETYNPQICTPSYSQALQPSFTVPYNYFQQHYHYSMSIPSFNLNPLWNFVPPPSYCPWVQSVSKNLLSPECQQPVEQDQKKDLPKKYTDFSIKKITGIP